MRIKHWLYIVPLRLRSLFRRAQVEQELDEELRYHLDRQIEELIAKGMTPEEARYTTLRAMGGVERRKEECRDMRRVRLIEDLMQDVRYSLRTLRKSPGFTAVSVFTLALGIGANTAIFSVVNAVLLRALPYRDPDRLVLLSEYRGVAEMDGANGETFKEWQGQAKAFEQIAAYTSNTAVLTGSGEPERLPVGKVSSDLFATLGVAPTLGRAFTPAEYTDGGEPVVILSDGLWRRRFGGDPKVIGRALTIEGQSRTVVGIMAPGFRFPEESDLWLPLVINSGNRWGIHLSVLARLRAGVTPEAAGADLSVILDRKRQAFPGAYSDLRVRVITLGERLVGNVRLALLVLFGAVAFVLVIACANVANLLLARAAARQKEMAIRLAIGAGRLRLVRQLLTESLLLSLLGGAAGLLAAKWGVKLLVALSPAGIARMQESEVDGRALGFTCVVALLTGLIAGAFPALQASKTNVNETIKKQQGAQSGQGGARRALHALMIAELALALVLLTGAGLMTKSFLQLLAVPSGFNPDGVLTLKLWLSRGAAEKWQSLQPGAYVQESLDRVRALPGIQSAALASALPLAGPTRRLIGIEIEGRPPYEPGKEPGVDANFVSPEYFQTMGIQIRAGRPFTFQDGAEAPRVVIINETLARQFFPNENPIGHRLLFIENELATIVGVVGDAYNRGLDSEVYPEIYGPGMQNPKFMGNLLVARVASGQNNPGGLSSLAAAIRKQAQAIEPDEPVNQVVTMDERLSNSVAARRFQMQLLGAFAGLALVITTVGIYGVISYAVSQRTHEIGVRMALGAQRSDVARMVIWRGMRLTLVGVALGLAAALALTRVMKNLLFEVSATDPATFALIALLLVAVALIGSYIPARRAAKVDPLLAIRNE
jgi:putative ABC transport system permease protein